MVMDGWLLSPGVLSGCIAEAEAGLLLKLTLGLLLLFECCSYSAFGGVYMLFEQMVFLHCWSWLIGCLADLMVLLLSLSI